MTAEPPSAPTPASAAGRIAIVVQRYGAEVNGGAEGHARTLAVALRDQGFTVQVLTSRALDTRHWEAHYPAGDSWLDGVQVTRFDHPARPRQGRAHMPLRHKLHWRLRHWLSRAGQAEVARPSGQPAADGEHYLQDQGPTMPGLLRHLADQGDGYQAIIFFTALFHPCAMGSLVRPGRSILIPTLHDEKPMFLPHFHRVFRAPAAILFNTEGEAALAQRLYGTDLAPHAVCGLGIAIPTDAQRQAARQRLPALCAQHGITRPYLLYLGRVDAGKGCDRLFAHWQALPADTRQRLQLVVVGQLQMPAPDATDIVCTGFASAHERDAWLEGCQALVNPSAHESLSLVVLEAMARGATVLVNPESAVLADHVRASGVGHCVRDAAGFAAAVQAVLARSEDACRREAEQAQAYVRERYAWPRVLAQLRWAIGRASASTGASTGASVDASSGASSGAGTRPD